MPGNEQLQWSAQKLAGGPAKGLFGSAVVLHDALAAIHGDDRVHGRVEQPGQLGCGSVKRRPLRLRAGVVTVRVQRRLYHG